MKMSLIKLLLILSIFPFLQDGFSQAGAGRPKIGLTLSGGGAKGLAHIGILEALDSAGLRIDAITGTSMGSIIGALYATGYSGDTIERIARTIDWNRMFSTTPRLDAISIEKKDEFNKYALEVPYENGKFRISKGIIEGQELWLKFTELFEPVCNLSDFSQFPIPFKCIGTDLETGDAVVMDHGDITTCVRASMAIPTVFTPVMYEGRTLVDGGLVNNFPVLDVKGMGADLVIGVNLNKGLEKAEELKTPVDILLQICFYKDAEHFQKHRDACDIYILPDLKDYSAGSFTSADSIIDIGKECAKRYYPVFKRLADSLNALYPAEPFIKNRLPRHEPITISEYTVEGLKHTKENFFFGLMGLHMDETYSSKKFTDAIRRAYSSLYYNKINYEFSPAGNNSNRILFKVEENPLTTVKFALNYNSFSSLGFILNVTSQNLFVQESRALATIGISSDPRLYLEYYKYIGRTRDFGLNFSYYSETIGFPIYQDFRIKYNLRSTNTAIDMRFQHNIRNNSYFGIGQRFIRSRIRTPESPQIIYDGKTNYFNSYASYLLNSTDRKYFTTSGWKIHAEAGYVYNQSPDFKYSGNLYDFSSDTLDLAYENYLNFFFSADHFRPAGSKFVFSQNLTVAYISDRNPYISNKFLVGGINLANLNQIPFAGLEESEVKTGSLALFRLGLQYRLARSLFLSGRFNIAYYDFNRQGSSTANASDYFLTGYGLSLGFDSLFGPIEITSMYCDQDGKLRYNINIGFNF